MVYLSTLESAYSYTSNIQETKNIVIRLVPQFAVETCRIDLILNIYFCVSF